MIPYLTAGLAVTAAVTGVLLWKSIEHNGTIKAELSAAQAVIKQRDADAKLNAEAVAQLAEKVAKTDTKVVTVTEKIYVAAKTDACVQQPAVRIAIDGVRDLYGDSVRPAGGREPQGPVRSAGAAPGAAQR